MKHKQTMPSFLRDQFSWLTQLNQAGLISSLFDLCSHSGLYIVNQNQEVLYWNGCLERMTGIVFELGSVNPCPSQFQIDKDEAKSLQLIADNHPVLLKIIARKLTDNAGQFAGGVGLVCPGKEAVNLEPAPKSQEETKKHSFHGIFSRSPAMKDVFRIIQNAAQTEATVLVRGESGSGKELVAKAIHTLSARHEAPFLAINCAALSSNLLESELFGHVRGAFTGAIKDHDGLFKRADGGTLFLDEVAEMPLELQAKLLRVIQERNYVPVGGSHSLDVDVRLVAATHRSLREEVKLGRFREDLMYRLRVVPIFLPPLRERREDISLLLWHFIHLHNDKRVRVIEKIDPDAMKVLLDYPWPGNVRELHNVVEYAFAVGRGSTLRLAELPPEFREPRIVENQRRIQKANQPLDPENEASAIRKALDQSNGQVSVAAELLGMSRATFWRKRKHYGI
jgi:transcriptional regulator with PAS, ATPase and Fis domain